MHNAQIIESKEMNDLRETVVKLKKENLVLVSENEKLNAKISQEDEGNLWIKEKLDNMHQLMEKKLLEREKVFLNDSRGRNPLYTCF